MTRLDGSLRGLPKCLRLFVTLELYLLILYDKQANARYTAGLSTDQPQLVYSSSARLVTMGVDNTPVEQLMSTDLLTVTPDTDITEAADILLDEGVGSLIVLDAEDHPAGVLTSTDFVATVSTDHSRSAGTVGDYMTKDVLTVSSTATLHDAAVKMIREDIQHLPVARDEDEVVGMLSATDLTAQLTYMGSSGTD